MKEKIIEIGIKKFQIEERPGESQVVTVALLESFADEILELICESRYRDYDNAFLSLIGMVWTPEEARDLIALIKIGTKDERETD